MNGGDLRFHISRKCFTEEAIKFWIAEMGCALRYIHSQGIIHRDVKPDNVLLDSEGHVHLADFVCSLCQVPSHEGTNHCRTSHLISDLESLSQASPVPWPTLPLKCTKEMDITPRSTGGVLVLPFTSVSTARFVLRFILYVG